MHFNPLEFFFLLWGFLSLMINIVAFTSVVHKALLRKFFFSCPVIVWMNIIFIIRPMPTTCYHLFTSTYFLVSNMSWGLLHSYFAMMQKTHFQWLMSWFDFSSTANNTPNHRSALLPSSSVALSPAILFSAPFVQLRDSSSTFLLPLTFILVGCVFH